MTLDTWEALDRLGRYATVEEIAEDAGQTVAETRADLASLLADRAVRRRGATAARPVTYRALRVAPPKETP